MHYTKHLDKSKQNNWIAPFHTFDNTIDFKRNPPYIIFSYVIKEIR